MITRTVDHGTAQHECTACGEWEECAYLLDRECDRDEAGWVHGRFYCKDCAEDRY